MLIAQITDTHIVDKQHHWLAEPSTEISKRLEQTVDCLNKWVPKPDVVFLTGDATDFGTEPSYVHLREILEGLNIPLYVIPGNHDSRENMRAAFSDQPYMPTKGFLHYTLDHFPIRFICLDTHVPGKDSGEVCEEQLLWLRKTLKADSKKPTMVFMHHPPAKTGNKLFDSILCAVPLDFEELIRESKNLLGLFTGHYHHLCVTSFGEKLCFMAPSIAPVYQFEHPEDDQPAAIELKDSSVTLHQWNGSTLMSHVVSLQEKRLISWSQIVSKQQKSERS